MTQMKWQPNEPAPRDSHPQLVRRRVWCRTCGRSEQVNTATALRYGWPKCCGFTMTLDAPEGRGTLAN